MDVQQIRGILSGLWSSDHIGLSIRELNNLVAEFVAAPKPCGQIQNMELNVKMKVQVHGLAIGEGALHWVSDRNLYSATFPLSVQSPVRMSQPLDLDSVLIGCRYDPARPGRLLVMASGTAGEVDIKTGMPIDEPDAIRSVHLPFSSATDAGGGIWSFDYRERILRRYHWASNTSVDVVRFQSVMPSDAIINGVAFAPECACIDAQCVDAVGRRIFIAIGPRNTQVGIIDLDQHQIRTLVRFSETVEMMAWLSSNRLLIITGSRVYAYDLLSDEVHCFASFSFSEPTCVGIVCVDEQSRTAYIGCWGSIKMLNIASLLSI